MSELVTPELSGLSKIRPASDPHTLSNVFDKYSLKTHGYLSRDELAHALLYITGIKPSSAEMSFFMERCGEPCGVDKEGFLKIAALRLVSSLSLSLTLFPSWPPPLFLSL